MAALHVSLISWTSRYLAVTAASSPGQAGPLGKQSAWRRQSFTVWQCRAWLNRKATREAQCAFMHVRMVSGRFSRVFVCEKSQSCEATALVCYKSSPGKLFECFWQKYGRECTNEQDRFKAARQRLIALATYNLNTLYAQVCNRVEIVVALTVL
jgi:hypothetical protein